MGLTSPAVILALLGVLHSSFGFVRLNTASPPWEHPAKADVQNVTLNQLTSGYLENFYSDLTLLKISNSKIYKIDKYAFDYLNHLNLLEISDSEVSTQIDPETFSRLPGLEILILRNIGMRRVNLSLTHVQQLVLSRNEMEILDGESIVGKDVSYLDMSENGLRFLKGSFANLSKLSMIDISKNKISQVGSVFERNVNLLRILASENRIASTEGLRLPWLRNLDLFSNRITALDSDSFSKMTALEGLVLAFNSIKHLGDAFKDLLELKYLNLAWNYIEELHPDLFRNNLYLTELSLQGNRIKVLNKFRSVHHHLTHLDLSHNQLALINDGFFTSTPSLQVLDLSFNHLKTLTDTLAPLAQLKTLNLAYNQVVMTGYELSNNRNLRSVNLSSNALEGGISNFNSSLLLKELDLSGNQIIQFCDADVVLKNLVKVNLRGNLIESLRCLEDFRALCQIDLRNNPVVCGEELDGVILTLAEGRRSPYKLPPEFGARLIGDECEKLPLNESFVLWNSIKRELCPKGRDVEMKAKSEDDEWDSSDEEEDEDEEEEEEGLRLPETKKPTVESTAAPSGPHPQKKQFIVVPIGWIGHDEMNKPNPLQNPQSERSSWEKIDENAELLKGFEEEGSGKRSRFSWYTIALILIGLSLTLTCFNFVVFLYIKTKIWKKGEVTTSQKYTVLHNEVYKNTTEPTKSNQTGEGEWFGKNQTTNKIFSYGKINELLLNFRLNAKDKDSESAKNVLIDSKSNSSAQIC